MTNSNQNFSPRNPGNEYRIDIKVRNNLILKRVEEMGYRSIAAFCKAHSISYLTLVKTINMQEKALDRNGVFNKTIEKTCLALKCCPEDIFTESQLHAEIKTNKRTVIVDEAEAKFLLQNSLALLGPDEEYEKEQKITELKACLKNLSYKERKVLEERYGLADGEEKTYRDAGKKIERSVERARQIECAALRKIRRAFNKEKLRSFLDDKQ